ncbi:sorting nexin-25, partial [Tremellales sp. Uapishka_1]
MTPYTPQVITGSLLVLVIAYALPRLSVIQVILISPLFAVTGLSLCIGTILYVEIRKDRAQLDESSTLARERHALRPLTFTTTSAWSAVLIRNSWEEKTSQFSVIHPAASPAFNQRLDTFLLLVKKTFILPWYTRISSSPAFPNATEEVIRQSIARLVDRAKTVDWPTLMTAKVLPHITSHLKHFRSIEQLASQTLSTSPTLPLPLPSKPHPSLSPQVHLPAGATSPSIEAHLRGILTRTLEEVLPDNEQSEVVNTIVREVILGAVLLPIFDMLCDGDFWNRQIDEKGGQYLHEQKQVNKFLSALSSLPQPSIAARKSNTSLPHPRTMAPASSISAHSSTKQIDAFLRSIPKLKTLGDARRLKADVDRELRVAKIGEDDKTRRRYVDRLEKAKREIDIRIMVLSGQKAIPTNLVREATKTSINLYSVLADPSSLAFWLEYMDRRSRSRLVQFWLTVEGFKDPLDAGGGDSSVESASNSAVVSTISEDVRFLYDAYFTSPEAMAGFSIPSKLVDSIKAFAADKSLVPSSTESSKIKLAVFAAQKAVYEQMQEEDWSDFKNSELYLKAVADLGRSATILRPPSPPPPATPPPPTTSVLHAMPPPPKRQITMPIAMLRNLPPKPLPILVSGGFPLSNSSASVLVSSPRFERSRTSRDVRPIDLTRTDSATSLAPTSPPQLIHRGSTQLDFLISAESEPEKKLFDDDDNDIPDNDNEDFIETQRIEAIHAALSEIIASDDLIRDGDESGPPSMSSSLVLERKEKDHPSRLSSRSAEELKRPNLQPTLTDGIRSRSGEKPSKLFLDDDVEFEEDQVDDIQEVSDNDVYDVVQMAAPGDLELSVEIARLEDKIKDLVKQDHLLDTLIRQAELTGSENEIKLLLRSQSSVRREQRTVIFQKAQFEQQEEENRLVPGRTHVTVPSSVITSEEGKQVVRYMIEVAQPADDDKVLVWVVARRYNEFWALDKRIRDAGWSDELRGAEIPGKRLVTSLSAAFVDSRRIGLEKYLQVLISSSPLCESSLLRSFLSRSVNPVGNAPRDTLPTASLSSLAPHNIVKSLYKTMAGSLDDALLGPSMLDLMSQTLTRQVTEVAEGFIGGSEDIVSGWLKNGAGGMLKSDSASTAEEVMAEAGVTSFTAPICDLFIEIFDLKENNWLRRQAIVIILQQVLGGTVERKFRDAIRGLLSSQSMEKLLSGLQETMWPAGERREAAPPRTEEEKAEARARANKNLGLLIPDVAANMIGRGNARRAARSVFGALQDRRLNQQLILTIMDEIVQALFPPPK